MTFVATDQFHSETTTWLTPLPLVRALGEFDLDPCAFPSHEMANTLYCLPERDGLHDSWFGRVWLNPPYGREAATWLKKLKDHGNGIALIFARLETQWIQEFIADGFFQLQGRISFIASDGNKRGNAGAANILIPFGRKNIGTILSSDLEGKWFQ